MDVLSIRKQFPALAREKDGQPIIYFDGPAGSQVPESVIDAIVDYLKHCNANCGGPFLTSRETDEKLSQARVACADFLGVEDSDEIVFGPNMTTLTFALSRTLSRDWKSGDEILISRLDHDANFTPWVLAAERAGAVVHKIDFDPADCTFDLDQFQSLLSEKTKLVAMGAAANSTGTINPVGEIVEQARKVGALTFIDAVHFAPHRRINIGQWGCDFLVCSAYKFFGPHVGILWGRRQLLEQMQPDKLRPAPNDLPEKWMSGTQNHEGITGVTAAIDYLASLSGLPTDTSRRDRLDQAFERISTYETEIGRRLIDGMKQISSLRIWGISNPGDLHNRVPTISVTHSQLTPKWICEELSKRGIQTWAGNHYAVPFTEHAGLEPEGTLRIGLLHYNTREEIDLLLKALEEICK